MARVLTISKPYVAAAYRDKLTELARRGFEVGLICPPAWGSQAFETPPEPEFWCRQVPILLNGRNHFHYYVGLEEQIAAFRPDLINCEEEHYSLVTWQVFRIAKKLCVPVTFYTWQNIYKRYPPPFRWIERMVFAQTAAAICGNQESIDVLRRKGYRGRAEEVPQMGVALSRFMPSDVSDDARRAKRAALGLPKDGVWASFFGRLVPEKGLSDLVTALTETKGLSLLIGGGGPEEESLRALAKRLGVESRLRFAGSIPSAKVADYLQAMDILCLPSLTRANWKEQFGRILIEAMAAGAVVIGSSSGEIPRVIGDAGLVFPEGDAGALAKALNTLAASPERRAELRERALRRVKSRFTNGIVADKLAALFSEILSEAK